MILMPPTESALGLSRWIFATGELWKLGRKLKLTGQPFSVLAILLERPGEVISREEFQRRLWPDTFVDVDHNLNTAINKIRETLADSAERPRFVETLSRRGYRFIAPIGSADPQTRAQSADTAPRSGSRKKNSWPARAEDGFWIAVLPLKSERRRCRSRRSRHDADRRNCHRPISFFLSSRHFAQLHFAIRRQVGRRASGRQGAWSALRNRG